MALWKARGGTLNNKHGIVEGKGGSLNNKLEIRWKFR